MSTPVTLMDGGMGTSLRMRFPEKLTRDPLWSARMLLSDEGANEVVNLHGDFITAGSRVVTTNNYACVPLYLERAENLDLEALNALSVSLCERAIDRFAGSNDVKIAVSLPPLRQSYSTGERGGTLEEDMAVYDRIVRSTSHRADFYVVETVSTAWASVAPVLAAAKSGKKCLVSFSVSDEPEAYGNLRSGESVGVALDELAAAKAVPHGVLFNCAAQNSISKAVESLCAGITSETLPFPVQVAGAYANALKAIPKGWDHHRDGPTGDLTVTPEEYAATVDSWLASADAANAASGGGNAAVGFLAG
eukprot:gene17070-26188_t